MNEAAKGKKGAKRSHWSRAPMVRTPANWQRMVEWGRAEPKKSNA